MEISDLVVIGRLGRLEPDGFYCIQLGQSYKFLLNQLSECFLIFSSQRVFFVTVVETKLSGPRAYWRFMEDGIAEECRKSAKVLVALAPEDVPQAEADETSSLVGYTVQFMDEIIGTVSDAMVNRMQSVLMIELTDGRELLVPNVEHYVVTQDITKRLLSMQNLELLLELCTSTS
jgi:ribosomal 30S subunit maturation factor RimM